MSIVSIEVETPELNTDYTTAEQWDLITQAKALLDQAGAAACIWVRGDVADAIVDGEYGDDLTQAELDRLVDAAWPNVARALTDPSESDRDSISFCIDQAVAEGAHREKIAA